MSHKAVALGGCDSLRPMSESNHERAARGAVAVEAYSIDRDLLAGETADVLLELLVDLRHYMALVGADADTLIRESAHVFREEATGRDCGLSARLFEAEPDLYLKIDRGESLTAAEWARVSDQLQMIAAE